MALDQDIIKDFQTESVSVIVELRKTLSDLEESEEKLCSELLENFAQKIDRIMGAAKTLAMLEPTHKGLEMLSKLTELCKSLGYQVAEKKDLGMQNTLAAFFSDVLEIVDALIEALADNAKSSQIVEGYSGTLKKRLEWLALKIRPS